VEHAPNANAILGVSGNLVDNVAKTVVWELKSMLGHVLFLKHAAGTLRIHKGKTEKTLVWGHVPLIAVLYLWIPMLLRFANAAKSVKYVPRRVMKDIIQPSLNQKHSKHVHALEANAVGLAFP